MPRLVTAGSPPRLLLAALAAACGALLACGARAPATPDPDASALFAESQSLALALGPDWQGTVLGEIASSEAEAGQYSEAAATVRKTARFHDLNLGNVILTALGQHNITQALALSALFRDPASRNEALVQIAEAEAANGDARSARKLMSTLPASFQPGFRRTLAIEQAEKGDIADAWAYAQALPHQADDELYTDIATAAQKAHNRAIYHLAAQRISPAERHYLRQVASGNSPSPPAPCARAMRLAKAAKIALADRATSGTGCNCESVALLGVAPDQPAESSQAMRDCTDPNLSDISSDNADLAQAYAKRGDIAAARQFLRDAKVPGADQAGEGYIAPACKIVSESWARGGHARAALQWARARPTELQRAYAVLGVARALAGHANAPAPR